MKPTPPPVRRKALIVFCSLAFGGAERQGMYLARHLQRSGWDVHVWSTYKQAGPVSDLCADAGIPCSVHPFRWPCRKASLVRDGIRFTMSMRRLKPDIVIPYTTWPNVGCGLAWRLSGVRACVWGQRNIGDLRGDGIERFAYRRTSAVICNARHEIDYLTKQLGPHPRSTHVVYNGHDLPPPVKDRQAWRRQLSIPTEAPVATMVANFRPQKDHETLLRAWALVDQQMHEMSPRPHLLLAGLEQQTAREVRALTDELRLQETVTFLGPIDDVSGLLAASDIGVLVSHREGLSNSLIEYMMAGLPAITSDLAGNREALGDEADQSWVSSCNVTALADRLISLIGNPQARRQRGDRNRQRALSMFSIEAMCCRFGEILTALASDNRCGPLASACSIHQADHRGSS